MNARGLFQSLLSRWWRHRAYAKVPYPYQSWTQLAATGDKANFYPDFLRAAVARERAARLAKMRKAA
ncbi:hypothetical protein [Hymenobacter wooponensis]|uniref:Uncharacterized protein n=1 Tax=Hymenobacter wooponensis TaxID=1525360 RepID=A0A4Z0MDM8_9BACT|nr:hypothetical protein [Hymenobacter wooponensis]TGD77579.1 hypothetical protein EU557_22645 [Hymenobacter wooponensis]